MFTTRMSAARRAAFALLLGALLVGCVDPHAAGRTRSVQSWLAEESVPLSLRPAEEPPEPVLIEQESVWLETAGLYALAGAATPWISLAFAPSLELTILATPIFAAVAAIYGGVTAEPEETALSLQQVSGTATLLTGALLDRRFENRLISRVIDIGKQDLDRRLLTLEPKGAIKPESGPDKTGVVVTLALKRFAFVRDLGDEEIALAIEGTTYIAADALSQRLFWRDWERESAAHPPAAWMTEDGALWHRTLEESIEDLARGIVESLREALPKQDEELCPSAAQPSASSCS